MMRLLALIACLAMPAAAAAQTAPAVEDYAAMTNLSSVSLSPSGDSVAFISGENRADRNIIVSSLVGAGNTVIDGGDDQVVVSVSWANDEHLLVTYVQRRNIASMGERTDIPRTYIIPVDSPDRGWELNNNARLANRDLSNPDEILVWLPVISDGRGSRGNDDIQQGVGLFRQGMGRDRDRRRVFIGEGGYNYVLNTENEPVLRYGGDDNEMEVWARQGNRWQLIHEERWEMRREFSFGPRRTVDWVGVVESIAGLDASGEWAYFSTETTGETGTSAPGRRRAVYRMSVADGSIEGPVVSSDLSDITGFIRDWRTNAVIGVQWSDERRRVEFFDGEFADLQTQLEGFFPSSNVTISSWDQNFRKVVVNIEGGETSGSYYLLDRETGQVALLARTRPRIPDETMSPVEILNYTAQDGLELFGYVTLPRDRAHENLPAVLLPHGGPEARDFYGYDEWAQLLASRGYVVFQPQFRGSGGFGVEFAERGYGNWGEEMQTDLWDGMQVLVDQGIVDPERVCIFGWSYGGYAALAGATITPELYRCVIAGAAVSDILTMMDYEMGRFGGASVSYWARNIGDWRGREDEMRAISPAQLVGNIQAPLMLVHGTDDLIVPFSQAEYMARAMDNAGLDYELVAIEDGPHQSYRMTVQNKLDLYENLERFLFEHNPPD